MAEHALLVMAAELPYYGLSNDFISQFDAMTLESVLQAVTDEVLGRIYPAYVAPLTAWGADLKGYAARIAVYELKSVAGMAPTQSAVGDENLLVRAQSARDTLDAVGKGQIPLQGVIDSSTAAGDGVLVDIASDDSRGW